MLSMSLESKKSANQGGGSGGNGAKGIFSIPGKVIGALAQRMAPPKGKSEIAFILEEDTIRGKDVLGIEDLTPAEIDLILEVALKLKANKFDETQTLFAKGQTLAMLFEKPSLRTRVTFEAGMTQLGGNGVYLEGKLGKREPVSDVAKNLDRWLDGIMARTFDHETLKELAANANIPVINGLSDREHPCQAMADYMTIVEHKGKDLSKAKVAYIGDGNNVAASLMLLCAKVGIDFYLSCPDGYEPMTDIKKSALEAAKESGSSIHIGISPVEAATGADVIYTDTWVSMGQEEEYSRRVLIFKDYQVNEELVSLAKEDVLIMHCLPAHRGEEVTAEVLDGPKSVIYDQAENRLHAQKAILSLVL